jgi:hypothetical protein
MAVRLSAFGSVMKINVETTVDAPPAPVSVAARLFSLIARLFVAPLRWQLLADLEDLKDLKAAAERRARR